MRRIPKLVRVVAAVGAASLIATACGGDSDPEASDSGDTTTTTDGDTTDGDTDGMAGNPDGIVQASISEPRSLIPTNAGESEGIRVLKTICRGLTYLTSDGELINMVAEDISTEDNKVWTVKIADGWTFHDGSKLDAQDYVDTWNFGADPRNGQQNNGFFNIIEGYTELNPEDPDGEDGPQEAPEPTVDSLSGLEVVDELTFKVTLTGENTTFPLRLPYAGYYAIPSEVIAGGQEAIDAYNEKPVCNGPYQMDGEWQHDVVINTVRYDGYAGPDAAVNGGVTLNIHTDSTTAWQELIAGNIDVYGVPPEFQDQANSEYDANGRMLVRPSDVFLYLGFPVYDDRYSDPVVRQALSMAIDRDAIVENILAGVGQAAHSWISPPIPGHREDPCGPDGPTHYNPEKAKEMLDGTDFGSDPIKLWVNAGNETAEQWITAVGNMFQNTFGLEFEIDQLPFAEYLDLYYGETFDGPFRLGWGMDYPHPQNFLEPLYGSEEGHTGYSSAEFDAKLAEANAVSELEDAIPLYQQAEDFLCTDVPVAPMFFRVSQIVWNDTIADVPVDGYNDEEFHKIQVL